MPIGRRKVISSSRLAERNGFVLQFSLSAKILGKKAEVLLFHLILFAALKCPVCIQAKSKYLWLAK